MLSALLQTIANLGFDVSAVNRAFNEILEAVNAGQTQLLDGVSDLFGGVFAFLPGHSEAIGSVAGALLSSVLDLFAAAGNSSVLHMITGA